MAPAMLDQDGPLDAALATDGSQPEFDFDDIEAPAPVAVVAREAAPAPAAVAAEASAVASEPVTAEVPSPEVAAVAPIESAAAVVETVAADADPVIEAIAVVAEHAEAAPIEPVAPSQATTPQAPVEAEAVANLFEARRCCRGRRPGACHYRGSGGDASHCGNRGSIAGRRECRRRFAGGRGRREPCRAAARAVRQCAPGTRQRAVAAGG